MELEVDRHGVRLTGFLEPSSFLETVLAAAVTPGQTPNHNGRNLQLQVRPSRVALPSCEWRAVGYLKISVHTS